LKLDVALEAVPPIKPRITHDAMSLQ
jgi:hypothetical protein